MKRVATGVLIATLVAAALGGGYWWGAAQSRQADGTATVAASNERKILYYRNPMGQPDTSRVPKKTPDGMDYVPVYADEGGGAQTNKPNSKLLYYRNPMGLKDTSPVPKKDPMGMDYVAVYEGEEPVTDAPLVKISVDKVQKLGVKTEVAALREFKHTIRAVATVQADERRLYTVAPKFEGWIQKLYVNTTGQVVKKGAALMDVYSPDLISAQQEYLIASKGVQAVKEAGAEIQNSMRYLKESALTRLRNWDISAQELQRFQREGKAQQFLTLRSQVSGVVLEKPSIEGKRFMPGEVLYQIADLSAVWLLADVFEQDLGLIQLGQPAKIRVDAYPEEEFTGRVAFIYPTVTPETRTAKVRIELPNASGSLKPAMYARVELATMHGDVQQILGVPDSAVLDSGTRQIVLVRRGEGAFEPREVKLGMRADGYVQVMDGLKAGENVVVSANFLIDAESNLKAALGGMVGMVMGGTQPAAADGGKPNATSFGGPSRPAKIAPASEKPAAPSMPGMPGMPAGDAGSGEKGR